MLWSAPETSKRLKVDFLKHTKGKIQVFECFPSGVMISAEDAECLGCPPVSKIDENLDQVKKKHYA
jgi:hypothetical protein